MDEFINTIEVLGDEETLAGLVSHELTIFNDEDIKSFGSCALRLNDGLKEVRIPNVGAIGGSAFRNCSNLETLDISNATSLGSYAISYCYRLTELSSTDNLTSLGQYNFRDCPVGIVTCPNVTTLSTYLGRDYGASGFDFSKKVTIAANQFNGAYNMSVLILRSSKMCTLSNVSAFTNTPLRGGYGWIYVPSDLVNTYKGASNWSTFASRIVPISEYPKEFDGGTITDTWSEIFAAENDGTYSTKYSVGDTKALNVNGACALMQIAAFDEDDLADNTGKAKITWISVGFVAFKSMNPTDTTTGGWADCELRDYMQQVILPNIDSTVRSNIKPVSKVSYDYVAGTSVTTTDSVWIPSFYEVTGNTTLSNTEKTGANYTGLFGTDAYSSSSTGRVKKHNPCGTGSASYWWLRSAYNATKFRDVNDSGNANDTSNASGSNGLVLGFCT